MEKIKQRARTSEQVLQDLCLTYEYRKGVNFKPLDKESTVNELLEVYKRCSCTSMSNESSRIFESAIKRMKLKQDIKVVSINEQKILEMCTNVRTKKISYSTFQARLRYLKYCLNLFVKKTGENLYTSYEAEEMYKLVPEEIKVGKEEKKNSKEKEIKETKTKNMSSSNAKNENRIRFVGVMNNKYMYELNSGDVFIIGDNLNNIYIVTENRRGVNLKNGEEVKLGRYDTVVKVNIEILVQLD